MFSSLYYLNLYYNSRSSSTSIHQFCVSDLGFSEQEQSNLSLASARAHAARISVVSDEHSAERYTPLTRTPPTCRLHKQNPSLSLPPTPPTPFPSRLIHPSALSFLGQPFPMHAPTHEGVGRGGAVD